MMSTPCYPTRPERPKASRPGFDLTADGRASRLVTTVGTQGSTGEKGTSCLSGGRIRRRTVGRASRCAALAVAIALGAVACGDGGTTSATRPADDALEPEVVVPTPTPNPLLVPTPETVEVTHTVVAGDTPSGIAAQFGISLADLLEANGLTEDSVLSVGDTLVVPGVEPDPTPEVDPVTGNTTYTVVAGDTLGGIAAQFGITLDELLAASGLSIDSVLQVGQQIEVPAGGSAVTTEEATTPPPSGTSYVVEAGDTLGLIAAQFGITLESLLEANGLTADSVIEVGRTLNIPGG